MQLLNACSDPQRKSSSGQVAKERLRLVLAHDRANIPPGCWKHSRTRSLP